MVQTLYAATMASLLDRLEEARREEWAKGWLEVHLDPVFFATPESLGINVHFMREN